MKRHATTVLFIFVGVVAMAALTADAHGSAEKHRSLKEQREYCRAAWQEYIENQRCFKRFRTPQGVRGEAFQYCKDVPNPSGECPIGTDLRP